MLGTFYFYALAHQADFDVCWCKGSVSERIFAPLIENIKASGAVIQGGRLVSDISLDSEGNAVSVTARDRDGGETVYPADAVVFAVGITGVVLLIHNQCCHRCPFGIGWVELKFRAQASGSSLTGSYGANQPAAPDKLD